MAPTHNQPTYDFLTGAPIAQMGPPPAKEPLRESLRHSQTQRPDTNNEDLRAQVNTLQYQLEALKQERELAKLHNEQQIRDAQKSVETEHRRAQEAENGRNLATSKYDSLYRELQEVQTTTANERVGLEKKLRSLQDQNQQLQEESEEVQSELQSLERQGKYKYNELETRFNSLQSTVNDLQEDLSNKAGALQLTQQKLSQKEEECGKLESELLRLKGLSGGSEELAVVKNELSEQVTHIRKLESAHREQLAELKKYQKNYKGVEVVEEEKRALESRLVAMNGLQRDLGELQLRKQALEDERNAWASYLERETSSQGDLQFESPEQLARAFVQERMETASLLDKLGKIQPELAVCEENIKSLEEDKAKLTAELEKLRSTTTAPASSGDAKVRMRLERQCNLAVKEAEYLRAQLSAYGMEETEGEDVETQKAQRIQELEGLVDQYRSELQTVNKDLAENEKKMSQSPKPEPLSLAFSPKKRPLDLDADERVGELMRKNRKLQEDLSTLQKMNAHLETDLKATTKQITSLKSTSRTRILEFRNNPTAKTEAIKLSTIKNLRDENAALLGRLQGQIDDLNSVPISSLLRSQAQIAELESTIAEKDKRMMRLKQIWTSKAAEFREAIASLMGYKIDFMPNGRVRLTSLFYPGDEETGENSIVFDGEKGEMKVSGGPKSAFANEIRGLIDFWVDGHKEIPCFVAAMTLEFHEKRTRAREQAAGEG